MQKSQDKFPEVPEYTGEQLQQLEAKQQELAERINQS
jgi:hypothetical protein